MLDILFLNLSIYLPILLGIILLLANKNLAFNPCELQNISNKNFNNVIFNLDKKNKIVKISTLLVSLFCFLCVLKLYKDFNPNLNLQFVQNIHSNIGLSYYIGLDAISLLFLFMSNVFTIVFVLSIFNLKEENYARNIAYFLIAQGACNGLFVSNDALLFYFFWEFALIPNYLFLIENKVEKTAVIKYFLYNFFGSLFLLAAILYLQSKTHNFSLESFYNLHLGKISQIIVFLLMFISFSIKLPMWPFHTWLTSLFKSIPAFGFIAFTLLTLKLGVYGFLKLIMPIVPDANMQLSWLVIVFALITVLYPARIVIAENNLKKWLVYSSMSHMGLAIFGLYLIFILYAKNKSLINAFGLSVSGGIIQFISHSFSAAGLFLIFAIVSKRFGIFSINDKQNYLLAKTAPVMAFFALIFALCNIGLPLTAGFVGEWMIIIASIKANLFLSVLASLTLVLAASYTLYMYKNLFFAIPCELKDVICKNNFLKNDLMPFEIIALSLITIAIILIGVYPDIIFNNINHSVTSLINLSLKTKL